MRRIGPPLRLREPTTWVGVALWVATFATYLATLCPTVYWYDSAEFAAHAVALGVPHPPGYPLHTMVAHVFTWLPLEPALAVNLMSAVFGASSVVLVFVFCRRLGCGSASAAFSGLLLASGLTFWSNAVVSEVYTPGLFFTLGVFVLLERGLATNRRRLLIAAGYVGGLGLGMHMSIATCGLGYVFLVACHGLDLRRPADLRRWFSEQWTERIHAGALAAVAVAVGSLVYLYIPWRRITDYSDARQWVAFRKNATGGTFKRKFMAAYDLDHRSDLVLGILVDNVHWLGLALAAVGLAVLVRRRPAFAIGLALGALGNVWWFFNYDVPDLDVFLLPTIAIICVLGGAAIDGVARAFTRPWGTVIASVWLAFPLTFVVSHWHRVDLSEAIEASEFGHRACNALPQNATIVMWSQPDEWRYYSVFIYLQDALQACASVEIVKKPPASQVFHWIKAGRPIFTFVRTPRLRETFAFEPAGPIFRVRTRDARAVH